MFEEGYTDRDGWTRGRYLDKSGFVQLLWKTLQELGFHSPLEYYWRKEDTGHKQYCTVYVHIPDDDTRSNWRLEEVMESGFEFNDSIERAAMTALTELCENHKVEIGSSSARFYPIKHQDDGEWKRRIKALKNTSRVEHDVLVAAASDYMTAMYNLHQACIREYYNQRQKNEDTRMEVMGARYDKEMYKKAAMAREHEMEKAMREQSRRIEDYEEKLRAMQGFIEASRSMADRAREEAESNVHRLEAERFQQLDEILSLRLALEEIQAQAPAQNIV